MPIKAEKVLVKELHEQQQNCLIKSETSDHFSRSMGLSANQLIVFCFLLNLPRSADSSALGHLLHLHLVCGKRRKFPASLVF